jgi:hypothetical protein
MPNLFAIPLAGTTSARLQIGKTHNWVDHIFRLTEMSMEEA